MGSDYSHRPVQIENVLKFLITNPDGIYVDGTLGEGGHALEILSRLTRNGILIGIERDEEQLEIARKRLKNFHEKARFIHGNFADIDTIVRDLGIDSMDGILLDLGLSSYQIERSGRGFSFMRDEPLDMRMDKTQQMSAFELINNASYEQLKDIIKKFGEEKMAGRISRRIIRQREKAPIRSSKQLSEIIHSVVKGADYKMSKNPATRTFQAIRIAVNRELENLKEFLNKVPELINKGGRLVILSYHSLEDRIVKRAIKEWEKGCTCPPDIPVCICNGKVKFRAITRKGLRASQEEIRANPRARSSILRAAERV